MYEEHDIEIFSYLPDGKIDKEMVYRDRLNQELKFDPETSEVIVVYKIPSNLNLKYSIQHLYPDNQTEIIVRGTRSSNEYDSVLCDYNSKGLLEYQRLFSKSYNSSFRSRILGLCENKSFS